MRVLTRIRRRLSRASLTSEWWLMVVAAIIGLVMGGVAMAFILPLRWVERHAETIEPALLLWLIPLCPVVGALLTGVVLRHGGETASNPGVSSVMLAIHRQRSQLHWLVGVRKWIASTLTIASGGSAGAEGPIATIGAVIGSNLSRLTGGSQEHTATLLGCGAAAGIASVFNAPIAGVFFVLEILLRDFSLRTFTPIVIASVIASALTQAVLGSDALFAPPEAFNIGAFNVAEIPAYLLLGVVTGVAAVGFVRSLSITEDLFRRVHAPAVLKPAIGAALLGVLGLATLMLKRHAEVPEFYGNGYPVITGLLNPAYYGISSTGTDDGSSLGLGSLAGVLLALALVKMLATCLTLGSGGSGGLFAPSLLLGAAIGGAMGCVVNSLGWFPAATPAHYAVVGMAAMVASTTHAPLTGILIVYEITRSYEIILPLMFAAVIGTVTARLLFHDSIYTVRLTQMGVRMGMMSDLTILRRMVVGDVPLVPAIAVRDSEPAQRLLDLTEQSTTIDFVVTDDSGRYIGMVTAGDLTAAFVYREALPLLQVRDLKRSHLPTLTRDETLDTALDKFTQSDAQSLAVLDERMEGVIIGLLTRHRLMCHYQLELNKR